MKHTIIAERAGALKLLIIFGTTLTFRSNKIDVVSYAVLS